MFIFEDSKVKKFRSSGYNYNFRKSDGLFLRWGRTPEEDPQCAPSPELLDIEISTVCTKKCSFCYKSNGPKGENMSFETAKKIIDKIPRSVVQIAFGVGSIERCPDAKRIFEYTRSKGIIPNTTINGDNLTDEIAEYLSKLCGAVAVSHYSDEACYGSVEKLTRLGMTQVNIHALLSEETLDKCHKVIEDIKTDPRLKKLNAIVFLTHKPKGKRNTNHSVRKRSDYENLIKHAVKEKVPFGFDSCFAPVFEDIAKGILSKEEYTEALSRSEPCESGVFSGFIDVLGMFTGCSFCPGVADMNISVLDSKDFIKDVWNHEKVISFRENLLKGCRRCPIYPEIYSYV